MRGAIHLFLAFVLAQSPLLPDPATGRNTPQHIAVATSTSASAAAPGSKVSLFLDVTPNRGIHVYAPGTKDYLPIALTLTPPAGVTRGAVAYPKSETITFDNEPVPVYQKPFRLTQDVTVPQDAAAGSTLAIAGVVDYQACDDVICFKPAKIPVTWTLTVK